MKPSWGLTLVVAVWAFALVALLGFEAIHMEDSTYWYLFKF